MKTINDFSYAELWNIYVDVENWQADALPAVFVKNSVDMVDIFKLILKELDFGSKRTLIGNLGSYKVYTVPNKDEPNNNNDTVPVNIGL